MFTPILCRPRLPLRRNRRKGSERGQSLVEFALLLPVLMIILLGVVEFGWAMKAYVQEQNAAREGARYWALNGSTTCDKVRDAVESKGPGALIWTVDPTDTTPPSPPSSQSDCKSATGTVITVTAKYQYPFITPLGNIITTFADGLTMTSTAKMRVE